MLYIHFGNIHQAGRFLFGARAQEVGTHLGINWSSVINIREASPLFWDLKLMRELNDRVNRGTSERLIIQRFESVFYWEVFQWDSRICAWRARYILCVEARWGLCIGVALDLQIFRFRESRQSIRQELGTWTLHISTPFKLSGGQFQVSNTICQKYG